MNFKNSFEKFFKEKLGKNYVNYIILALIGVLLFIVSGYLKGSNVQALNTSSTKEAEDAKVQTMSTKDFEAVLKSELKYVLEQIDGVGKVDVMIYCESGEEQVPAVNINESQNTTEEVDNEGGKRTNTQKSNGSNVVMTNNGGGNTALILKKYNPKVTGVCVVSEGASNSEIKYLISKTVEHLFDIPSSKVTVLPKKK